MTMEDLELVVKSGEGGYQPVPGAYIVEIKRYEVVKTRYGEALRLWVNREGEPWPSDWGFVVSMRLSPKSKLGAIVKNAGFGELKPGDIFRLSSLLGKRVGVIIGRNEQGFARLMGVFPPQPPF